MKFKLSLVCFLGMLFCGCSPTVVVTPLKTEQVPYIEQPGHQAADSLAVPIKK